MVIPQQRETLLSGPLRRPGSGTITPSATATTTIAPSFTSQQFTTLRLRAESGSASTEESGRRVQWAEDVVNNEGMGRKKSKVCCIYHKPRNVGESSDEDSSSSSDSGSDSDDDGAARPSSSKRPPARHRHPHHKDDGLGHDHDHGHEHHDDIHVTRRKDGDKARRRSPNAYEKVPRSNAAKATGS